MPSTLSYLLLSAVVALPALVWLARDRSSRTLAVVTAPAALLVVLAAVVAGEWAAAAERRRLVSMVSGLAPTYAAELARAGHASVTEPVAPDDPVWLALIDAERRWLEVNPAIADVYTFRRRGDGAFVLVVDSETDYDRDGVIAGEREARTAPGEVFEPGPGASAAFAGTSTFDPVPVSDRWGTWVSAFEPLRGPDGGVEAVLGVDFPAEVWVAAAEARRRATLALGLIVQLVLIGAAIPLGLARRDGARRARTEEELRAALEAADRLASQKGELLATVSHEIRNPLNGIIGMTEMLFETSLDDEQAHYASAVRRSSRLLLDLLNDLLDLSKAEAGAVGFHLEPTDVRDLATSVVQLFAEAGRRKRVEVVAVVDPAVPDLPFLDAMRVRQILGNLVGNAVKFTDRGEVVLELGWRALAGASGELVARVRDTGVGVAAEDLRDLFRPYRQAGQRDRQRGGTGLGLAIARRLAEGMGGAIEAASEPGIGSEFTLRLPVSELGPPDQLRRRALATRTLLVVSARPSFQASVRADLTAMGATVLAAGSWAEAASAPADGAVVDGDLEGAPTLRAGMPAVVLAAVGGAPRSGFSAVLQRPADIDDLRRVLARELARRPAPDRPLRPVRVLVVDGNPVNQVVLVTTLRGMGCEVDVVASAAERDRAVDEAVYDLVLVGTRTPAVDTTLVRSGPTRLRPPTVAVSSSERSDWTDLGVDARLRWPPQPAELARTLREWVPDAYGTEA